MRHAVRAAPRNMTTHNHQWLDKAAFLLLSPDASKTVVSRGSPTYLPSTRIRLWQAARMRWAA